MNTKHIILSFATLLLSTGINTQEVLSQTIDLDSVKATTIDSMTVLKSDSMTKGRPKVAVVLSGGGAKGMAHIGALKVIERAGIPVDIVTGTSMGSIIGGLYSIGYDAMKMDSLVKVQNWPFVLSDKPDMYDLDLYGRKKEYTYFLIKDIHLTRESKLTGGGFIIGKNLANLFNSLTAGYRDSLDFNSFPRPFACVATNIVDNSEYVFHHGTLAKAMRASMAIPGVFAPVRMGDMVLVDGGLRNNFPVDVAREMGADYVIGVTVQAPERTAEEITGSTILTQIVDVNCKNKYNDNMANTDILIRANTKGYSYASFTPTAVDTLINRGEEEALKHWDELLALKKKIGLADNYYPELLKSPVPDDHYTNSSSDNTNASSMNLDMAIGARFDTEESAAIQANTSLTLAKRRSWIADFTIRLGKRIMAKANLTFHPFSWGRADLSYTFRHNDLNIYEKGEKDYNLTYNEHQVELNLFEFSVRNFNFTIGGRFDYYRILNVLLSKQQHEGWQEPEDEHLISYHADVNYNSEDNWYFPTRGASFKAGYAYYTNNFVKYNDVIGFSGINAMWRMSFPMGKMLTFQPMLYGRLLMGKETAVMKHNVMGGDYFGHYMEQQIPFAGVNFIEVTDKKIIAAQMRLQLRLSTNNYLIGKVSAAQSDNDFSNMLNRSTLLGYELGYYYNSLLGPLGASVGYSNKTKMGYFLINLGFEF